MMNKEIIDNIMNGVRTLFWLSLLVIFTYTPILAELLSSKCNILKVYYEIQQGDIALLVNIGLLGMVMIDYFSVKPAIDGRKIFWLFTGIVAIFVINVHSRIMNAGLGYKYADIINNNYLSLLAHALLLIIVGYFKYLSLKRPKETSSFVATKIFNIG